jgi:hypothetical protein
MQIDLATDRVSGLAKVAGYSAHGLAATQDRVFVANPPADQVWVFDRQRGRRVQVIEAVHRPVSVGVAPSTARAVRAPELMP